MTNHSEAESWEESFKQIKNYHDEAYFTLQDACNEDVDENLEVALEKYKKGLEAMNAALNVTIECPEKSGENYKKAVKMIYRLKDVKPKIVTRIENIEKILEERKLRENNPTTFSLLVKTLKEVQNSPGSSDVKRELVFCCEDVKFYNIKQDGTVTLSLENTLLEIYKYKKTTTTTEEADESEGTFFLQITKTSEPILAPAVEEKPAEEEASSSSAVEVPEKVDANVQKAQTLAEVVWTYPLLPGVSPCFRTRFGAIIFPDLRTPPDSGATIGIQVEGLPDVVLMEVLDEILKCVHYQSPAGDRRQRSVSVNVSDKITKGAFFISQGLIKGSQKTGELITFGTPYLLSRLSKAPEDAPPVSTRVRTGVEVAKTVTGTAASVTGFMAQKLGSATMALGRFIAPHLQNQGSRLLSQGLGLSQQDASEKMADALTVAAGAVEAFSTVYTGLEESASILGRSLSNNSVKVIDHKYGPSAGSLASNTFETIGNMFMLSQNVKVMTPKGIAKKTAKSAGKALVEDFQPTSGPSTETDIVKTTDRNL